MKRLTFTILFLQICFGAYSQNCFERGLPVYNGIQLSIENKNDDVVFADIKVGENTKIEPTKDGFKLTAEIICTSIGNAAALNVRAIVTLPGESKILSFTVDDSEVTQCLTWGNPGNTDPRVITGFITFERRSLDREKAFKIIIETSSPLKTKAKNNSNFSVFAFSQIPDNDSSNNFWSIKK